MSISPKRLLGSGNCYYHVISRVVDRRFVLGKIERERFRQMLEQHLGFAGVECVTYCVMSNHFHLLLRVPNSDEFEITDTLIVDRVRALYPEKHAAELESALAGFRGTGRNADADALLKPFVVRMHDLSILMQELKSRFTRWFNQLHDRRGTLWEERFRSVLVEGSDQALEAVAAYIDLNPVRGGIVDDPKDYRHCGYSEAVAGVISARDGIGRALTGGRKDRPWGEIHKRYRRLLYGTGRLPTHIDPHRRSGELSEAEILRCRIRHFGEGLVIGSAAYLKTVFEENRSGFRRMRSGFGDPLPWSALDGLRALKPV